MGEDARGRRLKSEALAQNNEASVSTIDFDPTKTTTWLNDHPTEKARLRMFVGPGKRHMAFTWVEFEPGERKTLPSAWDQAIHTTDRLGNVIGGMGPMLKKVGQDGLPITASVMASIVRAAQGGDKERAFATAGIVGEAVNLDKLAELNHRVDKLVAQNAELEKKAAAAAAPKPVDESESLRSRIAELEAKLAAAPASASAVPPSADLKLEAPVAPKGAGGAPQRA